MYSATLKPSRYARLRRTFAVCGSSRSSVTGSRLCFDGAGFRAMVGFLLIPLFKGVIKFRVNRFGSDKAGNTLPLGNRESRRLNASCFQCGYVPDQVFVAFYRHVFFTDDFRYLLHDRFTPISRKTVYPLPERLVSLCLAVSFHTDNDTLRIYCVSIGYITCH